MTKAMNLTPKQRRFVEEYLIDLNATQAAVRAGYSAKNADKIGPELLGKTRVAKAIAQAVKARSERTEIDQDWIIEQLTGVYEASMEARPLYDKDGNEKGFSFNPSAANKALELLGKLTGQIKDAPTLNLFVTAEWREVQGLILSALEPHPEARLAVASSLARLANGHGGHA